MKKSSVKNDITTNSNFNAKMYGFLSISNESLQLNKTYQKLNGRFNDNVLTTEPP